MVIQNRCVREPSTMHAASKFGCVGAEHRSCVLRQVQNSCLDLTRVRFLHVFVCARTQGQATLGLNLRRRLS